MRTLTCGENELRRGAAQGAGQWRADIGGDDDLFGGFLGRHLLGGRRGAGRRIDQTAVLENFFDLDAVEGLVFEEGFRDRFEMVCDPAGRFRQQFSFAPVWAPPPLSAAIALLGKLG